MLFREVAEARSVARKEYRETSGVYVHCRKGFMRGTPPIRSFNLNAPIKCLISGAGGSAARRVNLPIHRGERDKLFGDLVKDEKILPRLFL